MKEPYIETINEIAEQVSEVTRRLSSCISPNIFEAFGANSNMSISYKQKHLAKK